MDMVSWASAASGLSAAGDIVKAMIGLRDEQAIRAKVIELQGVIMSAQSDALAAQASHSMLIERNNFLEKEVMRAKDWAAQKERYELADTGQGSLAYRLKDGVEPPEPPHWLCPACYQQGRKSILKHETVPEGRAKTLVCHPCGFDIVTYGVRHRGPHKPTFGRGRG